MFFPRMRNDQVLVRVRPKETKKVGVIELSGQIDRETEQVDILDVGPGIVSAAGGRPSTHDLKVGQIGLAHMKMIRPSPGGLDHTTNKWVPIIYNNEALCIIHESQLIAIIKDAEVA